MTKFIPDNPKATYKLQFLPRLDAAAAAGVAAVVAGGGSLTGAQIAAVNAFILGLKTNSLWSSFYGLYLFVGGTAGAHAVNWKSPGTRDITWVNSPIHNANGVTFNGTTNYGRCVGLTGGSVLPHLCGLSWYVRTTNATSRADGTYAAWGGIGKADSSCLYFAGMYKGAPLTQNRGALGVLAGLVNDGPPKTQKNGLISINRTSTTSMKAYDDGVEFLSYTTSDTTPAPPAIDVWVGGINSEGALNSACNENIAFHAAHDGFTAGQSATFSALMTALQTALGRNV